MDDDRTPAAPADWTITFHESMAAIDAAAWDRCAGADNPLQSHALLAAMEDSGSAIAETGWIPRHLSLTDTSGRIAGVMPFYVKTHSYGEYVFDHAWANAWARAGGDYYPGDPVYPGSRPAADGCPRCPGGSPSGPGRGSIKARAAMDLSSLHITFLESDEAALLGNLAAAGSGARDRVPLAQSRLCRV